MNITSTIIAFGYVGIAITVFAESGFLLGFFLPGDSLLFTAGLIASFGHFNILILLPIVIVAAVLGDSFGYWVGKRFGPAVFAREDSFLFKRAYVEKTREFYENHGKKTVILARFMPIIRTFVPIFAGVGDMHYHTFLTYNIIGGILWACVFTLSSYFLGRAFPGMGHYLGIIITGIVVVSALPIIVNLIHSQRKKKRR